LGALLGACGNQTTNVTLTIAYTFSRDHPNDNLDTEGSTSRTLAPAQCAALQRSITQAVTAPALSRDVPFNSTVTVIKDAFPMVLRLPGTGAPAGLPSIKSRAVGLQLFRENVLSDSSAQGIEGNEAQVLARGAIAPPQAAGGTANSTLEALRPAGLGVSLWWTVTTQDSLGYDVSGRGGARGSGLQFGLVSDKLPPELLTSTLGASGILAMYLTIVLTIGRLARTSLTPPVEDAVYTDMPQCAQLVELAEGIDVARTAEYEGHLRDETRLYQVLLKLLRSPTILLRITADPDSPSGGSA
jgi:hypothetical protein